MATSTTLPLQREDLLEIIRARVAASIGLGSYAYDEWAENFLASKNLTSKAAWQTSAYETTIRKDDYRKFRWLPSAYAWWLVLQEENNFCPREEIVERIIARL